LVMVTFRLFPWFSRAIQYLLLAAFSSAAKGA
jgi:hypothetical protein